MIVILQLLPHLFIKIVNTICCIAITLLRATIAVEKFLDKNISEAALIAIPAFSIASILPLAIFLADKNSTEFSFDKNVIFRQVLKYKTLTIALLVDSALLVLDIKLLTIPASAFVLGATISSLIGAYKWFCSYDETKNQMTYRQSLRLAYLNSLSNIDEILEAWNLIFSDEKLSDKNQIGLVDAFIEASTRIPEANTDWRKSDLLRMFSRNFEKINLNNTATFKKLINFSSNCYKQKSEEDSMPSTFELRDIFLKLLRVAIEEKSYYSGIMNHIFFEELRKISNSPDMNKDNFDKSFLWDFLKELEKSDADIFSIWRFNYIQDLTITRKKLEDKKTREHTLAIFQMYDVFARDRIIKRDLTSREIVVLEKATEFLLPNIDPYFWFDISSFCYQVFGSYPNKNIYYSMIRNWCEISRQYGLCGRTKSFSTSVDASSWDSKKAREELEKKIKESDDKEFAETVCLLRVFHPWLWNVEECRNVLEEITNIKNENIFMKDSPELHRLEKLEMRFDRIIEFINTEKARK